MLSTGLQLRTVVWTAFPHNINAHRFGSGLHKAPQTSQDMIVFAWILFFFSQRELAMFGYHSFMPVTDPTKSEQCPTKDGPSWTACLLQWLVQESGQIFNPFFVWLLNICSLETYWPPKVEAGFLEENWLLATQPPQIKQPESLWHPSQAAQESSSLFLMKLFHYLCGVEF